MVPSGTWLLFTLQSYNGIFGQNHIKKNTLLTEPQHFKTQTLITAIATTAPAHSSLRRELLNFLSANAA